MTDTVGQRVQRYMLDGSDEDLRRLLSIAEVMAESAATALRRSGIGPTRGMKDMPGFNGIGWFEIGTDDFPSSPPTLAIPVRPDRFPRES